MTDGSAETFRLDQPQPNDLFGASLLLAGSGGGFEATIDVRVLDGNGQVLLQTSVTSTNLTSPWQASIELPDPLPTTRGVVEIGPSTGADESPARVSVPVFFGTALHRHRVPADLRGEPPHPQRSQPHPSGHRAPAAF